MLISCRTDYLTENNYDSWFYPEKGNNNEFFKKYIVPVNYNGEPKLD